MTDMLTRILMVEDDPDIQAVARLALEALGGFTVEMCGGGQEALQKAPVFAPDLILLDVMMPDMDGPTTLARLHELPAFRSTPVVFMTARVQQDEVERYKSMGAIDVIPKPFDPMSLADTVKTIWAAHQL